MPQFHKFSFNFNAGELSPFLVSRTDLKKYEEGCQILENFIILPYGGVIRRPGTQFIGKAKYPDKQCRLIGFNFSVTTNFILEFGDQYIRFWTNGIPVVEAIPSAPWDNGHPYVVDDRVNFEGYIYRCLVNHTSSSNFNTDFDAGKWEWRESESFVDPPAWATATEYVINNEVKRSGSIYRCLVAHTSTNFGTDLAAGYWLVHPKPFSAPTWKTAVVYKVNDWVVRTSLFYRCLVGHTSGTFTTDLAAGKWILDTPPPDPPLLAGIPIEVVSPYLEKDLRTIQYCQINDLMYLCHPNYPPHKLTRWADDTWTLDEISFKWPPLQDENIKTITITPSGTSGAIEKDVGSVWQVGHNVSGANLTYAECSLGAASTNSGVIRVRGPWSFTTYGTWSGVVRIHRTIYSTGVGEYIRTYKNSVDGQRNVSTTGTEDEDCSIYVEFTTAGSAGSSTPIARLEFANAKVYGLVKITGFTSKTVVSGTVTWGLAGTTATTFWSEPAFSEKWGYPRTVCLHEQRLLFGGTFKKPLGIHGSQIDDYENFQRGSQADHAFLFNLSANESNPVQWMIPQTKLLIGTAGDEWSMGPQNEDQALGPGNVDAKKQSNFGSSYLQARVVNEVVLFCQRQSKKLRELTYSFEKDGWVAPDLTILASHIGGEGFVETAFAQQPDAILWVITKDGGLAGMTYERDQNVVGWHRHSTDGEFESVGTIYGGEAADEVWFSVKRVIEGVEQRYIERFDPNFRPVFESENKEAYWYLDSGVRVTGTTESTDVTGLSHLEGKVVGVLGDGANQPERTVGGGKVTIQEPAKTVLAGLPYISTVKPMNLNLPLGGGDTMQGRNIRIHRMVVRLYKSLTAKFSSDGENWDEIYFRDRADPMDSSPPVFTGDKEVSTGATYSTQQAISVRQDRPLPLCLLAQVLWCDVYGE
jgi:hypothetical protein